MPHDPLPIVTVTENSAPAVAQPYSLLKIIAGRSVLAALIVALGAWMAGPLLALMAIGGILWQLRLVKRDPPAFRVGAIKAAIYGVAAVAAFGYQAFTQSQDKQRAELLIGKLEQYRQAHNAYPDKLQLAAAGLPPDALRSRYGPFVYWLDADGSYQLVYVDMPPGGKCAYSSKAKAWNCEAD